MLAFQKKHCQARPIFYEGMIIPVIMIEGKQGKKKKKKNSSFISSNKKTW